jgi:hypothetical protein
MRLRSTWLTGEVGAIGDRKRRAAATTSSCPAACGHPPLRSFRGFAGAAVFRGAVGVPRLGPLLRTDAAANGARSLTWPAAARGTDISRNDPSPPFGSFGVAALLTAPCQDGSPPSLAA